MNVGGIDFEEGLADECIAMTIDGKVEVEGMAELVRRVEKTKEAGKTCRMFLDLRTFKFDAGVVGEKLKGMSALWSGIDRLAYVVDSSALRSVIGVVDAVTPMHLRAFSPEQADEARAWAFED